MTKVKLIAIMIALTLFSCTGDGPTRVSIDESSSSIEVSSSGDVSSSSGELSSSVSVSSSGVSSSSAFEISSQVNSSSVILNSSMGIISSSSSINTPSSSINQNELIADSLVSNYIDSIATTQVDSTGRTFVNIKVGNDSISITGQERLVDLVDKDTIGIVAIYLDSVRSHWDSLSTDSLNMKINAHNVRIQQRLYRLSEHPSIEIATIILGNDKRICNVYVDEIPRLNYTTNKCIETLNDKIQSIINTELK